MHLFTLMSCLWFVCLYFRGNEGVVDEGAGDAQLLNVTNIRGTVHGSISDCAKPLHQ